MLFLLGENSKSNKRDSSIELLRIFAGISIIILHFNYNPTGGGALVFAKGLIWQVLMVLEIICVCAVNVFLLISGYFSCQNERINIGRILELIIQTSVFSFCFKIVSCALNGNFSFKVISSLLPVNYYVILYCSLMCLAPFVNKTIKILNGKQLQRFVIISFMVFSVYPIIIEVLEEIVGKDFAGLSSISILGSIGGYTIIHFINMYIIGAYIRLSKLNLKVTVAKLLCILILILSILWTWRLFLPDTAFMYCNPIVIMEAVVLFLIFTKIKIESSLVNALAPASFTCFLIHLNILNFIGINSFKGIYDIRILYYLICLILFIYVFSFVLMLMWKFSTKHIFSKTLYKLDNFDINKLG